MNEQSNEGAPRPSKKQAATDLSKYPSSVAELLAKGQLGGNEANTERAFGFGRGTMRRWRREGRGPNYSRPIPGGLVYYVWQDVLTWMRASGHTSRAEEVARG